MASQQFESFKNYIKTRKREELVRILNCADIYKPYSITISFIELFEDDPSLGNAILELPEATFTECNRCLIEIQQELQKLDENASVMSIKSNIHLRIHALPPCQELDRHIFPKNQDVGLYLQVNGIVIRSTFVKMLEYTREYLCIKCKSKNLIKAKFEDKFSMETVKFCSNSECRSTNLIQSSQLGVEHCKDYQEIKIQENIFNIGVETMPRTMWVTLEDNLVNTCKPGDNVTICGIVKRRWASKPTQQKRLEVELCLQAIHIQVNNDTIAFTNVTHEMEQKFQQFWKRFDECPLYGRDLILRSFCPQIYGMYIVKLAMMTTLAGATLFDCGDGGQDNDLRVRNEPHLLLVGDPGTGKSELLRFAAKITPRSVLTTGLGSTSAGLTATAVMENGEWHLEGGALVRADGGICCIDEFNSMKEHDRQSMLEAMEQQTISVAKAGIVCKLNTRCSIIAATNPKGSIDSQQSLAMNIGLSSPLLSRIDLILLIKDDQGDVEWDSKVSDYILNGFQAKSKFFDERNQAWSLEMLTAYFAYIKQLNPTLTECVHELLSAYYQWQRKLPTRNKATTTIRLLESLIRLSKAHARLMHHQQIELVDAVTAIILIESSNSAAQQEYCLLGNVYSTRFVDDPIQYYENIVHLLAEKFDMPQLLDQLINETMDVDEEPDSSTNNKEKSNVENFTEDLSISKDDLLINHENDDRRVVNKGNKEDDFIINKKNEDISMITEEIDANSMISINEEDKLTIPNDDTTSEINGNDINVKERRSIDSETTNKRRKVNNISDMLNLIPSVLDIENLNFNCDDDQKPNEECSQSVNARNASMFEEKDCDFDQLFDLSD